MQQIDYIMMKTALNFATLSFAKRKKVGAVLSRDGRILACGYNGTMPGKSNICETTCPDCNGYVLTYTDYESDTETCITCQGHGNVTNEFVLHAEQNILTFCNREGISTKDCDIYVTMAPCKTCSKLLASAGIKRVFYYETYRDVSGLEFLEELNIKTIRIKDENGKISKINCPVG